MDILKEIYESHGFLGMSLYLFILIVSTFILNRITRAAFDVNIFHPFKKLKRNQSDFDDKRLLDHTFFATANLTLHSEIPFMELCSDECSGCGRELVYKDLLYNTVEAFYHGFKSLIKDNKIGEMSEYELSVLIKHEIINMNRAFKEKSIDFGVPNEILRQYDKWLMTYIERVYNYIDTITGNPLYLNNIHRVDIILYVMCIWLASILGDIHVLVGDKSIDTSNLFYRGDKL